MEKRDSKISEKLGALSSAKLKQVIGNVGKIKEKKVLQAKEKTIRRLNIVATTAKEKLPFAKVREMIEKIPLDIKLPKKDK